MKVSHDWLKDYLGDNLPAPEKVEELLNFYAFEIDGSEVVDGDTVIDVDVLPNRSSDSLCHRGIARELATILDVSLDTDPLSGPVEISENEDIAIRIADYEACPRFTASLITGVEVKESPDWLKKRLLVIGQKPINNIVDATNYIMYALGQPLHAYDADLFPQEDGKWKFNIRFSNPEETVSLLGESGKDEDRIVELDGSELLVVDESNDAPVGLAGVKGGRYAGVHAGTKNIIIEAAHFDPVITRKTARKLGIVIDASKRFENEPSRELPSFAQREIINLIKDIAGGECQGWADKYIERVPEKTISLRWQKVNQLLGLDLSQEEICAYLKRIGAEVTQGREDVLAVVPPWERTDLNIEEDLVEEVARIHGLANIKSIVPEPATVAMVNPHHYYSELVRETLVSHGFSEVITSTFQKKGKLQLLNALASDKSYLRGSLAKNINQVLDNNYVHVDLLGLDNVKVFEIGTVFAKTEEGIGETCNLAIGVRTKGNGYNPKDDEILKPALQAVEDGLGASLSWSIEKGVAETDLSAVIKNLPVPEKYQKYEPSAPVTYQPVSPYPAIARDIAVWVSNGLTADEVKTVIDESAGQMCVRSTLFDTFSKDGRTSYAYRLVFQATDRTLTDQEINQEMEKVYTVVTDKGWEVR